MDDVLSNQLNQRRFSVIIFVDKNAPLYRMRISKAGGGITSNAQWSHSRACGVSFY
jgi:hypothetical protein